MSDLLDSTARQVRGYGNGAVHRLARAYTTPRGRFYRTVCRQLLPGTGSLLTTTDATCRDCGGPR